MHIHQHQHKKNDSESKDDRVFRLTRTPHRRQHIKASLFFIIVSLRWTSSRAVDANSAQLLKLSQHRLDDLTGSQYGRLHHIVVYAVNAQVLRKRRNFDKIVRMHV